MKRTVWLWELVGFGATALCGTLLHFLYEWLGEATWIAPFSGVNESTWEHMKLLFWPMLIWTLIELPYFKAYPCFLSVKLRSTLLGLGLIPTLFYLYNGIIGKSPDWVNITIFFVSAAAAYTYSTVALSREKKSCANPRLPLVALILTASLFVIFTFFAPRLGIFRDPLSGTYGI